MSLIVLGLFASEVWKVCEEYEMFSRASTPKRLREKPGFVSQVLESIHLNALVLTHTYR